MKEFFDYIHEFNELSIVLRVVLATLFGAFIGLEREAKKQSAGFRTFTLVALSSVVITVANIYLFIRTGSADVSRIPAGIISGIGFLGAGTILVTRQNHVRGLTTAAGLLATASLGIAVGSGMFVTSVVSFGLILLTMVVLRKVSYKVASTNRRINLFIEISEDDRKQVFNFINESGYRLISVDKKKHSSIIIEVDLNKNRNHSEIMTEFSAIEGVKFIEEI